MVSDYALVLAIEIWTTNMGRWKSEIRHNVWYLVWCTKKKQKHWVRHEEMEKHTHKWMSTIIFRCGKRAWSDSNDTCDTYDACEIIKIISHTLCSVHLLCTEGIPSVKILGSLSLGWAQLEQSHTKAAPRSTLIFPRVLFASFFLRVSGGAPWRFIAKPRRLAISYTSVIFSHSSTDGGSGFGFVKHSSFWGEIRIRHLVPDRAEQLSKRCEYKFTGFCVKIRC